MSSLRKRRKARALERAEREGYMPKKKQLRITKQELYLAVLLSCGPPPVTLAAMVGRLESALMRYRFGELCRTNKWFRGFTQLCIDNGEAKSRVYDQLKGFVLWHREAEKRVQIAESAVMEYMKPTE